MNPELAPAKTNTYGSKSRWDELLVAHVAQVQFIHVTVWDISAMLKQRQHNTYLKGTGSVFSMASLVHQSPREPSTGRMWLPRPLPVSVQIFAHVETRYSPPVVGHQNNDLYRYWDEQADQAAGSIYNASVFNPSPTTGFGTGYTDDQGCVIDGPFANLKLNLTTNLTRTSDSCLKRVFNDTQFDSVSQKVVDSCMEIHDYWEMWACLGNTPHTGGHFGVGGTVSIDELSHPYSSGN